MRILRALLSDRDGTAAAEMALVTPILLMLMFGAAELGNYFWNEHTLVKAVRDGARFAARQSFLNYPACSGEPGGTVVTDTQNIVIYGYRSGGTQFLTPNIQPSDITVQTECKADAGGQAMSGIYSDRKVDGVATGAQIVTVSASVDYRTILGAFGFRGVDMKLNAASQAAVTGI